MTAIQLIAAVRGAGGKLSVTDAGKLKATTPVNLIEGLRQHRDEIIALLTNTVLVPVPCTCSKWSFPHIHSEADRRHAIYEWNKVAKHKLAIQ